MVGSSSASTFLHLLLDAAYACAPFIASSAVFVLVSVALCLPPVVRLFPTGAQRTMVVRRA